VTVDRRRLNIFQEASDAPLREPGTINVTFTPRVFPTPTRESLAPEEEAVCGAVSVLCGKLYQVASVMVATGLIAACGHLVSHFEYISCLACLGMNQNVPL